MIFDDSKEMDPLGELERAFSPQLLVSASWACGPGYSSSGLQPE